MVDTVADMERSGRGVLYVSYDGVLEPLGQSQVIAYLKELARGYRIHLISYEKTDDWRCVARRERMRREIEQAGIAWHPLRYRKRPAIVATAVDVAVGIVVGMRLVARHRLRVVHARSYVASVVALAIKRVTGAAYVFDMRGLWADERVDGGLWPPGGRMFRLAKWFEARFLLAADHVVCVAQAGVRELERFPCLQGRRPPMTVIPTCADLSRFRPAGDRRERGGLTLGYVGSVGTWHLFDEVAAGFALLRHMRPEARLLVVNRGEHACIRERLAAAGVPASAFELVAADHGEVPAHMARMDAGIFFYRPLFSKRASAPTRLAEYLACGVPCLSNSGVGDTAEILEGERVGVVIRRFDPSSLAAGLASLLELVDDPRTRERCVAAARRHFALDEGVARYRAIYDSLIAASPAHGSSFGGARS